MERFVAEITYGGIDGLITTFGIISSSLLLNIGTEKIIILALANVLADGFSMASGSYLSEKNRKIKKDPLKVSVFTFMSFVCVGILPILPFFYQKYINPSYTVHLKDIIIIYLVILSILGMLRKNKLQGVSETVITGILCGIIIYYVSTRF